MKVKAQFTDIGGGDGRAFLGVNDSVGYIGASNGIFLFDYKELDGWRPIERCLKFRGTL